jgi:tetratricopeptide (TPR) repeat protein
MGQRLARREVDEGLRLYQEQRHDGAIRKWKRALHKMSHRGDRFVTLGYLALAHGDCGKHRDMLAYGIMQIDLANEADNTNMRAEAYLCLARSNEKLCEYHKAVYYSRHCLQNQPRDPRIHGYVYMCQSNAYFCFGSFTKSLENLAMAMVISKECGDTALELQVLSAMGRIFALLKDYEKGLGYQLKASELSKSFAICDISTKYQRLAFYSMALPLVELERYEEALACCEVSCCF